jgi:hypothetical protein
MNGDRPIVCSGRGEIRSCSFPLRSATQFGDKGADTVSSHPNVHAARPDVDALDDQLHYARLFGWEKFVPQGIEILQCMHNFGLSDVKIVDSR